MSKIFNDKTTGYLAITLLFIFICSLMISGLYSINQDIGRHIKTGEIIWQTKSVPKINLFSYTLPNHPFINHHWLSEVFFYLLNSSIGLKGLIVFKAILNTLSFLIIFLVVRKRALLSTIIPIFFLGAIIFTERTDVRPEIFSYLFLALFIYAIYKSKYEDDNRWLYILPLIQVVWVNSHIYFALGAGLLFLYLIDQLAHNKLNRAKIKLLAAIFLATLVATLVNPNFIIGALEPLNILRDYGYSIVENQNIFFLLDYGLPNFIISVFQLSVIIGIVSFIIAFKNKKKVTFEFLAYTVFTILAFKMIRNFGPYVFIFISAVTPNFYNASKSPITKKSSSINYGLIILLIFMTTQVINNNFYTLAKSNDKFGLEIPRGAEDAVKFIRENNIKGPVFNNFDLGSYIIWNMWPEEKVFVDGRPEAYGVDFFEKIYKPMQEDPEVWDELSEEYKINYVFFTHTDITPWAQKFLHRITNDKNWPLVYLDETCVIFLKNNTENKQIIDRHKIEVGR